MQRLRGALVRALHVRLDDRLELFGDALPLQRDRSHAIDEHGRNRRSPVPGRLMPILACLLSPGPLTTHPITATFIDSTPG